MAITSIIIMTNISSPSHKCICNFTTHMRAWKVCVVYGSVYKKSEVGEQEPPQAPVIYPLMVQFSPGN